MPKKILHESAINHLLQAAHRQLLKSSTKDGEDLELAKFIDSLAFRKIGKHALQVRWSYPSSGSTTMDFSDAKLYVRGDMYRVCMRQEQRQESQDTDEIKQHNEAIFTAEFEKLLALAGG